APNSLPPNSDPKERAKEASGLRYNAYTKGEIDTLQKLTAAGCSATPQLLGVKYDVQDSLILESNNRPATGGHRRQDIDWWIPGGYIVYILMTRLQAQPLGINTFWDERLFTKQDRDDIREAFQRSFVSVAPRHGVYPCDSKLENLMWDKTKHKCYIIDLEDTAYDPVTDDTALWDDGEYYMWNLARK
ncbi:MAG: hypothetical protein Q9180_003783, partial [Flavoplaca navasiana]